MKRRIIIISIVLLLLLVMAVSAFQIISTYLEYKKASDTYEDLQNKYVDTVPQTTANTEPENATEDVETETSPTDTEPKQTEPAPAVISVDFDSLLAENKDIVGWIYCPDTPISYPVVQGQDNDQYLRADLNGKYLVSGTLFVDYRNSEIGQDRNYIIYGHNMKNGSMFGSLLKYKEQSYYEQHPTITYLTPEGNYTIELIAGLVVSKTDIIYEANPDREEFQGYLTNAVQKSTFRSNAAYTDEDTLVILSTCSYEFDAARYVVIGKLSVQN